MLEPRRNRDGSGAAGGSQLSAAGRRRPSTAAGSGSRWSSGRAAACPLGFCTQVLREVGLGCFCRQSVDTALKTTETAFSRVKSEEIAYLRAVLWAMVSPPELVCPTRGCGAEAAGGWRAPELAGWLAGTLGALCQIWWVLVQKRHTENDAGRQPIVRHRGRIRMFPACLFPFLVRHLRGEEGGDGTKLP